MRTIQEICDDLRRTSENTPRWPHLLNELREANELLDSEGFCSEAGDQELEAVEGSEGCSFELSAGLANDREEIDG